MTCSHHGRLDRLATTDTILYISIAHAVEERKGDQRVVLVTRENMGGVCVYVNVCAPYMSATDNTSAIY